ncbi:unnamed protein product, partial [Sphenostylis stenocarpa]
GHRYLLLSHVAFEWMDRQKMEEGLRRDGEEILIGRGFEKKLKMFINRKLKR